MRLIRYLVGLWGAGLYPDILQAGRQKPAMVAAQFAAKKAGHAASSGGRRALDRLRELGGVQD